MKWTLNKESHAYTSGDFVVKPTNAEPFAAKWVACHAGQELRHGNDPVELMDYCEKVQGRL